ncbi:MAG: EthD domain-containing protein [Gammaproteobacteria bacterium]
MVKVCYCLRRLPNLSREEFQRYWLKVHTRAAGADAATTLGIRRYVQLHTLDHDSNARLRATRACPVEEFDGIAEVWFDGAEAMFAAMQTPAGRATLQAFIDDEARFIDWSRSTMLIGVEQVLLPAAAAKTKGG